MKTKLLLLIVTIVSISHITYSQDKLLAVSEIPEEITSYINNNFSKNVIIKAIKDTDGLSFNYEITLDDLTKLEFNNKKQIIEIESKTKLPDSVIPSNILNYVHSYYPNNYIRSWESDTRNQKIELNNGIDLIFDINGYFLKIDD